MSRAGMGWTAGKSDISWDHDEREKVRHMLNRGKSADYIRAYMGVPDRVIEQVRSRMNHDGSLRGADNERFIDIGKHNAPIAPDAKAIMRRRRKLDGINRRFVQRLKEAA